MSWLGKLKPAMCRPYMRVVEAQLNEDFDTLIKARPVGVWQETLAILVTYTTRDAFNRLCGMLAMRLQSSGMAHAATLCFISAGDVDSAVKLWLRGCTSSAPSVPMLQVCFAPVIVFSISVEYLCLQFFNPIAFCAA